MRKAEGLDLGAEPLGIKKILKINVVEYPTPPPPPPPSFGGSIAPTDQVSTYTPWGITFFSKLN